MKEIEFPISSIVQRFVDISCKISAQSQINRQTIATVDGADSARDAHLFGHMDIVSYSERRSGM